MKFHTIYLSRQRRHGGSKMNQKEIGKFIAKCRKEKNLTQAQLAEKLGITDRAVSKWETGNSMPDSSIMLELCGILGITVNELLSGEEIHMENFENRADENLIALKRQDENNLSKNVVISMIYSLTLLVGIMVCIICDIALSGRLTWSLIPISSIVFAWVISFPITILGRRGITGGLISLSLFILPYLYLLSWLIKAHAVFSIGARMAVIAMLYIWMVFFLFKRFHNRRLAVWGTAVLLLIPLQFVINAVLSKIISEPLMDIWDVLVAFMILIVASVIFIFDYAHKKGIMFRRQ